MFNLLPPPFRKKVSREYVMRSLSVFGYLAAAAVLLGATTLIPSYVTATLALSRLESLRASAEEAAASDPKAIIEAVAADTALLESLASRKSASSLVENVLSARQSGIQLTSISIDMGPRTSTLSMNGIAATRANLASFDRTLKTLPTLSNVTLPISNLAKNEAIPFSLTATILLTETSTP